MSVECIMIWTETDRLSECERFVVCGGCVMFHIMPTMMMEVKLKIRCSSIWRGMEEYCRPRFRRRNQPMRFQQILCFEITTNNKISRYSDDHDSEYLSRVYTIFFMIKFKCNVISIDWERWQKLKTKVANAVPYATYLCIWMIDPSC